MAAKQKVILLEHRPDFVAIYGLNLNIYLGVEVIVVSTVSKAISALKENSTAFIFVDTGGYSSDVGNEMFKALIKACENIPLFIVGKTECPQSEATIFDASIELRYILQGMAQELNVTAKMMASQEVPLFYPLPMEFIVPGWYCICELYGKEQGEDEFNAVFKKESVIRQETLDALKASGLEQLYVLANERLKFVNNISAQISSKLNDPNLSAEERANTVATGYQMVMEQARNLGIGQSTLELANDCIESMSKIVDEIPGIEKLVANLKGEEKSYRFKHSLLANYIGSHIIKKMPWGSKEQQDKLAFVCFFHDITLPNDEFAQFRDDKSVENSGLPKKTQERILKHAQISAKLVGTIKEKVPFGVETIIKQHHGSKTGVSLSKLSMSISPLAIVFIFAEEWADMAIKALEENRKMDKKKIIGRLNKKYNIPAFKKILPLLHTLEI